MKRVLPLLLVGLLVGVSGYAAQEWQMVSSCPPGEPFTYATVAEGSWTMVQLDEGWQRMALVSRRRVDVVEPYSGQPLATALPPASGMTFTGIPAFSPDGSLLACAMSDGSIRTWDAETGEATGVSMPGEGSACVTFSHDGALLAAQSLPGAATVWSAATGEPLCSLSELEPYGRLCVSGFNSDDTLLFAWTFSAESGAQATGVWDLTTGALVRVFPGTAGPLANGLVYALEPKFADDRTLTGISLWGDIHGTALGTAVAPGSMLAATFSSDGRYAALALADETVSIWDLDSWSEVYRLRIRDVVSVAEDGGFDEVTILVVSFSPDSSLLATGTWVNGSRAIVHLWNVSEILTGAP